MLGPVGETGVGADDEGLMSLKLRAADWPTPLSMSDSEVSHQLKDPPDFYRLRSHRGEREGVESLAQVGDVVLAETDSWTTASRLPRRE